MEKLTFKEYTFRVYRSRSATCLQVVIFHGICEHSLRYIPFIKKLNDLGIDCTVIDHPGHGQHIDSSINSDKVFNVFNSPDVWHQAASLSDNTQKKSFQKKFQNSSKTLKLETICDFQESFYRFVFNERIFSSGIPTILLGQSMGGLIAAGLGTSLPHLNGVILLSPAFQGIPKHFPKNSFNDRIKQNIEASIIRKSDESFSKNTLYKTVILKPLLALNPTTDCAWAKDYISDDRQINNCFAQDPYIGRKVALKFLQTIQQQMYRCRESSEPYPCPVFIEYGENDKIVSSKGSDRFINNRLTGERHFIKKLCGYEPHEIHNSTMRDELLKNLSRWTSALA